MALDPVVNFFRSTIATLPVASGGTSIVLQTGDGNKLPNPSVDGAFNLTIYNANDQFVAPEIVRVTARSTDTLTVTRAQEGTSATNKTSGNTWNVELTPTAKTIQDIDSVKLDKAGGTMTGDLTIPDKIIHSGDTNTAIRFPSDDTFAVETNGTEKIRATSTAVVVNESGLDQDFRVEGDTLANLVFVDASTDRVGINTATPATLLDVNGAVTASGLVTGGKFAPTANTTAGNGMYLPTTNTVAIGTDGTEAMRIDASQRVVVGATSGTMRFNVQNTGIIGGTVRTPNASGTTVSIYTITCSATSFSTTYNIANGTLKVAIGSRSDSANAVATYTLPFMLSRVGRSTGIVILTQGTPTLLTASTSAGNLAIDTVTVALSSASNTGATLDITVTASGAQSGSVILDYNTSIELTQRNKDTAAFTIVPA
jgi:hypothetical protein